MIDVRPAETADIDALVGLEALLFREDAGCHEPFADVTWPEREGHDDLAGLIESPDTLVLVAEEAGRPVGLLVGYAAASSPTRLPHRFAVLRSMYVSSEARRRGVGQLLGRQFLQWAREQGCAEAHVDHYAANDAAGQLYERLGFGARSITRTAPLTR